MKNIIIIAFIVLLASGCAASPSLAPTQQTPYNPSKWASFHVEDTSVTSPEQPPVPSKQSNEYIQHRQESVERQARHNEFIQNMKEQELAQKNIALHKPAQTLTPAQNFVPIQSHEPFKIPDGATEKIKKYQEQNRPQAIAVMKRINILKKEQIELQDMRNRFNANLFPETATHWDKRVRDKEKEIQCEIDKLTSLYYDYNTAYQVYIEECL